MQRYQAELLFRVYSAIMALMYFVCVAAALAIPLLDVQLDGESSFTFLIMGIVGFPLWLAYLYALMLPQKGWAWIYGLIAICVGLMSCCFWPICIPLLIMWIKPETKEWFEAGDGADGAL